MLPIFLNVTDLPVLIVGGGAVGCRRARSLVEAGARRVTVVAPRVGDVPAGVKILLEPFRDGHLGGQRLAYAATDSKKVNEAVARAASSRGVLCCRADNAGAGDFVTPLKLEVGGVVAAVSTGTPALTRRVGDDVERAIASWGELAEVTARLRPTLLASGDRAALSDLSTDAARQALADGGAVGLERWLRDRHPTLGIAKAQWRKGRTQRREKE